MQAFGWAEEEKKKNINEITVLAVFIVNQIG